MIKSSKYWVELEKEVAEDGNQKDFKVLKESDLFESDR